MGRAGAGLSVITRRSFALSPAPQGGGSRLRSPRHSHHPPVAAVRTEGRVRRQARTDSPVGPGPGGQQGRVSASLLPFSIPWALPGSQKQATHPTCSLLRASEGKAGGVTPTLGPRHSLNPCPSAVPKTPALSPLLGLKVPALILRPRPGWGRTGPRAGLGPHLLSFAVHPHDSLKRPAR